MIVKQNDLPEGWKFLLTEQVYSKLIYEGGIQQIKEKFGHLRIYYTPGTRYNKATECMLDYVALRHCMECGEPSTMFRKEGWIGPVCDEHERNKL